MSVQLNTQHYYVVAQKADYRDGKAYNFTGTQDKRWHTVERAASLQKAGFAILDITEDGESDLEGNQALLNRHGIKSNYAIEHKLEVTATNGKKAPAEKTMAVSFEQQEILAPPCRDTAKLATYIAQQIMQGKMPVDSVNLLATQCMVTLKTLGVSAEVINQAFAASYQPKK